LQRKLLEPFISRVEKACPAMCAVVKVMNDADAARPENYWVTKPLQDKARYSISYFNA